MSIFVIREALKGSLYYDLNAYISLIFSCGSPNLGLPVIGDGASKEVIKVHNLSTCTEERPQEDTARRWPSTG